MVDFSMLMARFRQLELLPQAFIVGIVFFVGYTIYAYFVLGIKSSEAIYISLASASLFMAVYYFTSVVLIRKKKVTAAESTIPKKGLRKQ